MNRTIYIAAGLILLLTACFEYNPNQIILEDDEKDLTAKNIARIHEKPASETIKFALMGDTQRFYDESDAFVKSINQFEDVDFVIHAGDISDFGLAQEFQWIHEIMSDIKFPYLTVIGNHDLLANGRKVYREMYGELDYTFEYGDYLFVMLNTNSREYDFDGTIPDLVWLRNQLENNSTNKKVIVISHMPPFDKDFDEKLEMEYADILSNDPNVLFSLHGHQHSFSDDEEYYDDGIRYFVTSTVLKREYAMVTLAPGDARIEIINY